MSLIVSFFNLPTSKIYYFSFLDNKSKRDDKNFTQGLDKNDQISKIHMKSSIGI